MSEDRGEEERVMLKLVPENNGGHQMSRTTGTLFEQSTRS